MLALERKFFRKKILEQTHVVHINRETNYFEVKCQSILNCAFLNRCLFPFFKVYVLESEVKYFISWSSNRKLGILYRMGIVFFCWGKMFSPLLRVRKFRSVFLAGSWMILSDALTLTTTVAFVTSFSCPNLTLPLTRRVLQCCYNSHFFNCLHYFFFFSLSTY